MSVISFEAIVEDGQISLPADVRLPDKTKVYVLVPDREALPGARIVSPRLAYPEQAADFALMIVEEADDGDL
jgi:hypothetical protein